MAAWVSDCVCSRRMRIRGCRVPPARPSAGGLLRLGAPGWLAACSRTQHLRPPARPPACGARAAGLCGSGPSVVLLPSGQKLAHVSTPARVAQVLAAFCDLDVDATLLKATELRLAGNVAARAGQLDKAVGLYTQVRGTWGVVCTESSASWRFAAAPCWVCRWVQTLRAGLGLAGRLQQLLRTGAACRHRAAGGGKLMLHVLHLP